MSPPTATRLRAAGRWVAVPAAVYLACFVLLTWPWARHLSTGFFCDDVDGYQNVWNLWWVGTAVRAGRSPWFTPLLHAPGGTTLLAHTLNPFNGFAAVPLTAAGLPLVVVHNLLIAFSFVAAGVTACRLAADVSGSYAGGLVAGFAFTFGGFHVEHAQGHMQLVSVEWLPLFLLLWGRLLRRPTPGRGGAAAVGLWLVLLCDDYYFLFAVLTGGVQLAWHVAGTVRRREQSAVGWPLVRGLGPFVILVLATCGPVVFPLLQLHVRLLHQAALGPTDLLAPLVPGAHWWAGSLTRGYWSRLPTSPDESSVFLGWSVVTLAVVGVVAGAAITRPARRFWLAVGVGFFALSLGPTLQVFGHAVGWTGGRMPYAWLEAAFPPLKLGGIPLRMMVMPSLAAAVLAACGVRAVLTWTHGRALVAALTVVLFVDLWPSRLPLAPLAVPRWVVALRDLPGPGAVIDVTDTETGHALYDQTVHHRPMASGYISRVPLDVMAADLQIARTVAAGDLVSLRRRYGFRYLVVPAGGPRPAAGVVYDGPDRRIVDLDAIAR